MTNERRVQSPCGHRHLIFQASRAHWVRSGGSRAGLGLAGAPSNTADRHERLQRLERKSNGTLALGRITPGFSILF